MNKVALALISGLGVFLVVIIGLFVLTSDADLSEKPKQFSELGGDFTLMSEYTRFYHPSLIGITGSKEEIDQVTKQYGAYYDFSEIESVTEDYGVEHSSRYYVIDKQGQLVTAMRHSTTPNELYAQILELL